MSGVIVGGVLALCAVALGLAGAVVLIRATSDATSRAQVTALRAARAEPPSIYDAEPSSSWTRRVPARRVAIEPPEVPGIALPGTPAPEPSRPEWQGW